MLFSQYLLFMLGLLGTVYLCWWGWRAWSTWDERSEPRGWRDLLGRRRDDRDEEP